MEQKWKSFLFLYMNHVLTGTYGAISSPGSVILTSVNEFLSALNPTKINKYWWEINCCWEWGKLWAQVPSEYKHTSFQLLSTDLNQGINMLNLFFFFFFLNIVVEHFQADREVVIVNEAQLFEFLHGGTWLVHLFNPYFWIPAVLLNNSKNFPILHHLCLSLWNDIFIYYKCDKVVPANL